MNRSLPTFANSPWMPAMMCALMLLVCVPLLGMNTALAQGGLEKKGALVLEMRDSFKSGKATIQVRRFEKNSVAGQPAIVMLHGCDGWEQLRAYSSIGRMLAEKGYVVIVIRYFDRTGTSDNVPAADKADFERWLKGKATGEKQEEARRHFDEWLATVSDAVAYARSLPNVEKDRVALAGFSLGAYLAVSAAADPKLQLSAVVELFGGLPVAFRPKVQTMPPTLILHGELDEIVSVKEAYALFGLLSLKGQIVEGKIYPGVGHAFIPPGKVEPDYFKVLDAVDRTTKFLSTHMKKEVAAK
jgi:dienelactone hydrolase